MRRFLLILALLAAPAAWAAGETPAAIVHTTFLHVANVEVGGTFYTGAKADQGSCRLWLYGDNAILNVAWRRSTASQELTFSHEGWRFSQEGFVTRVYMKVDDREVPAGDDGSKEAIFEMRAAADKVHFTTPSDFEHKLLGSEVLRVEFFDGLAPDARFSLRSMGVVHQALQQCLTTLRAAENSTHP